MFKNYSETKRKFCIFANQVERATRWPFLISVALILFTLGGLSCKYHWIQW